MVAAGLVGEVEHLAQKYGRDLPLLQTLGYREIQAYLQGDISRDEAIAQIVLHTCRFAKRQQTWFNADSSIEWFDSECPDLLSQVAARIGDFMATLRPV
jgi:tRNA dimethylallyltransferase